MRVRYLEWDEEVARRLRDFAALMALFRYLLLRTGGDVEEALRMMRELQRQGYIDASVDLDRFRAALEEETMIRREGDQYSLTRRGERDLRRDSLDRVFTSLRKAGPGEHRITDTGVGGELLAETRPYQFGDEPSRIDSRQTIHNAIQRAGPGDIELTEPDFAVHESEHHTSCATVLMLDVSHSMVLYGEDRFTPAKRVALAMAELITTRYPKDSLSVVLFGDEAREISIGEIVYSEVGPFHTNTKAGLELAQRILRRKKHANKQIFMVTDGKPSAITERGRLYKNPIGLDPKIVNLTLQEAASCRRSRIVITTFMIARDPYLVDFVERLTRTNKGRAYYSSLESLGEFVFVDYLQNRRRRVR